MALKIETAGKKIAAARKGGFPPLPKGPIGVTVSEAEVGEYGPNSANAGRANLKIRLKVEEGQVGERRIIFDTIPLFTEWAPTAKNPEGSDAFAFFQFFAALEGISEQEFRDKVTAAADAGEDYEIPDPTEILGTQVTVVLTIENDTYAFERAKKEGTATPEETQDDYKTNRVGRYKVYEGLVEDKAATETANKSKKYTL